MDNYRKFGMTPEEKARLKIDRMLKEAGWEIVDRKHYNPTVSAVAIEEGLLKGNHEADYLLFLEGKAVGVLEAKREERALSDVVAEQAENYTHKLLPWYQAWQKPLPLIYLSMVGNCFINALMPIMNILKFNGFILLVK